MSSNKPWGDDPRFILTTSTNASYIAHGAEAVARYARSTVEGEPDIGAILAATNSELPYIGPECLEFYGHLGNGTSFEVRKEIYRKPGSEKRHAYFVAVKYMKINKSTDEELRRLYATVMREIRVLMHPPLRGHGCITPVLAYGWTSNPIHGARPYLIVDFSDHGTLQDYFRRCRISLRERREMALDVAAGIQALHDNYFIHGDVKMHNVLVYGNTDNSSPRPQVAKLSDFGAALFRRDVEDGNASYLGTTIYNAPEISGLRQLDYSEHVSPFDLYKKADAYSFGLLLWEVMKNGEPFIDKKWLFPGEREADFLKRICRKEIDGLLERGMEFCKDTIQEASDSPILRAVEETFRHSIRDDPANRLEMKALIKMLARGTSEERLRTAYPLQTTGIPELAPDVEKDPSWEQDPHQPRLWRKKKRVQRKDDFSTTGLSTTIQGQRKPPPKYQELYESSLSSYLSSDATPPPLSVQRNVVEKLMTEVRNQTDKQKVSNRAEAFLQLSVCYQIGFGVQSDAHFTRRRLLEAKSYGNPVAKSIYHQVESAFDCFRMEKQDVNAQPLAIAEDSGASFCKRIRDSLETSVSDFQSNTQADNYSRLLAACREGSFDDVKPLVGNYTDFHPEESFPTPLHWMIRFPASEADVLAGMLVRHISVNSMVDDPVAFPEHCMELFGTPLHWAVRTGNLALVETLLKLGADLDLRWKPPRNFSSEPDPQELPGYSPLDLAVTFHFSEIVQCLLLHEAKHFGGAYDWKYSSVQMIGQTAQPFARFVIHGSLHRNALRRTLKVLRDHGLDINTPDSRGKTPLVHAMKNRTLEEYILEEILEAGASTDDLIPPHRRNIATIIAEDAVSHAFSPWKLHRTLQLVNEINQRDSFGRNALHYAVINASILLTKELLGQPATDLNAKARGGTTPLAFAAQHGHLDIMIELLDSNAALDLADDMNVGPLEHAVRNRHAGCAAALVQAGAAVQFRVDAEGVPQSTVLHAALMGFDSASRTSVLDALLSDEALGCLRDRWLLNQRNRDGWAPLQQAALVGDYFAVEALLKYRDDLDPGHLHEALEMAQGAREQLENDGPHANQVWLKEGGAPEVAQFEDSLDEVVTLLKKVKRFMV